MNESLRLTALFVRDLLTYDEQLIRIGRQNYDNRFYYRIYRR